MSDVKPRRVGVASGGSHERQVGEGLGGQVQDNREKCAATKK